jgi:hypothetical protein
MSCSNPEPVIRCTTALTIRSEISQILVKGHHSTSKLELTPRRLLGLYTYARVHASRHTKLVSGYVETTEARIVQRARTLGHPAQVPLISPVPHPRILLVNSGVKRSFNAR